MCYSVCLLPVSADDSECHFSNGFMPSRLVILRIRKTEQYEQNICASLNPQKQNNRNGKTLRQYSTVLNSKTIALQLVCCPIPFRTALDVGQCHH
jgi:hypothetical protein